MSELSGDSQTELWPDCDGDQSISSDTPRSGGPDTEPIAVQGDFEDRYAPAYRKQRPLRESPNVRVSLPMIM